MTGEEIISLLENYNVKIESQFVCHFPISNALAIRTFGFDKKTINIWNQENGPLKPESRYKGSIQLNVIQESKDCYIPVYRGDFAYTREELVNMLDSIVELDRKSEKMYRRGLLDAV